MELRLKTFLVALMTALLFAAAACVPSTPTPIPTPTTIPTPTPAPTPIAIATATPRQSKIAVVSLRDGNAEIYVMDADGSDPVNLTNNPAIDGAPLWSPDGTKIAFQSSREGDYGLYVMNADGSGQVKVAHSPYYLKGPLEQRFSEELYPSWSPDGTRIAYEYIVLDPAIDVLRQIRIVDIVQDAGSIAAGQDVGLVYGHQPAWSPDGTRILFLGAPGSKPGLYLMDPDGQDQVLLIEAPMVYGYRWAPDSSRIAFVVPNVSGGSDICRIDGDGSDLVNLTQGDAGINDFRGGLSWAPDGSRIAFEAIHDRKTPNANKDVYVMGADGSNLVRLTEDTAVDEYPAWSPDSTKIAFSSRLNGLFVVSPDGSGLAKISDDWSWVAGSFEWSPRLDSGGKGS